MENKINLTAVKFEDLTPGMKLLTTGSDESCFTVPCTAKVHSVDAEKVVFDAKIFKWQLSKEEYEKVGDFYPVSVANRLEIKRYCAQEYQNWKNAVIAQSLASSLVKVNL